LGEAAGTLKRADSPQGVLAGHTVEWASVKAQGAEACLEGADMVAAVAAAYRGGGNLFAVAEDRGVDAGEVEWCRWLVEWWFVTGQGRRWEQFDT
tara:strand:- start:22 stop:306 length:285 start_codon:yes stop_codon:yes gene_type:complete